MPFTATPDGRYIQIEVKLQLTTGESSPEIFDITVEPADLPPVADAGPDQTAAAGADCRATVTLDGTGSTDPDNNELNYIWNGPFGTVTGAQPEVILDKGTTGVILTVNDGRGGESNDQVLITVVDATAPEMTGIPGPIVVEQAVCAGTTVELGLPVVSDNCDDAPMVTSDQPAIFPLGTTVVTFTAVDASGNISTATTTVRVVDTTPPSISATADVTTIWSPNHKMVPVIISAVSSDICEPAPVCRIVSVSSNEPTDGTGDGSTEADWEITGDLTVNLRAERNGKGDGRIYTIVVGCTDASGNTSTTAVRVTVPKNSGR